MGERHVELDLAAVDGFEVGTQRDVHASLLVRVDAEHPEGRHQLVEVAERRRHHDELSVRGQDAVIRLLTAR